jgi:hypothetical protein
MNRPVRYLYKAKIQQARPKNLRTDTLTNALE